MCSQFLGLSFSKDSIKMMEKREILIDRASTLCLWWESFLTNKQHPKLNNPQLVAPRQPIYHASTMDFPIIRNFLRSWTYEVFWPRHVTSAETPREIVKVSNLQSSFIQNPCFISCIPVGSSWYSLVHKGSLLRVAYDLPPVVVLLLEFLKLCNSCGDGRISRECLSRYTNVSIILAPLQFLTNGIRKKND